MESPEFRIDSKSHDGCLCKRKEGEIWTLRGTGGRDHVEMETDTGGTCHEPRTTVGSKDFSS